MELASQKLKMRLLTANVAALTMLFSVSSACAGAAVPTSLWHRENSSRVLSSKDNGKTFTLSRFFIRRLSSGNLLLVKHDGIHRGGCPIRFLLRKQPSARPD